MKLKKLRIAEMEENNTLDNIKFKMAEAVLYDYKYIQDKLDIIELKINKIKNDISVSAVNFDERTQSTNAFHSSVENEVIRHDLKLKKLEKNKDDLLFNQELVDKTLKLLDETETKLVELRYFSKPKKSWTSIASELCMTYDNCMKIRKKVITNIEYYLT